MISNITTGSCSQLALPIVPTKKAPKTNQGITHVFVVLIPGIYRKMIFLKSTNGVHGLSTPTSYSRNIRKL